MFVKVIKRRVTMRSNEKKFIDKLKLPFGFKEKTIKGKGFEMFHENITNDMGMTRTHGGSLIFSQNLSLKQKNVEEKQILMRLRVSSSTNLAMISKALGTRILVKRETT